MENDKDRMKKAGSWLQRVRLQRGLSQQQLATALGLKRHLRVSQYETGYARMSPELFRPWSVAMGLPEREVAKLLMSYYTPDLYAILLDEPPPDPERDFIVVRLLHAAQGPKP